MRLFFLIVLLFLSGCFSPHQLDDPFVLTPEENAKCAAVAVSLPSTTPFDNGDRGKREAYLHSFSESYRYHKALGGRSSYCKNKDDPFYAIRLKGWYDGMELVQQETWQNKSTILTNNIDDINN